MVRNRPTLSGSSWDESFSSRVSALTELSMQELKLAQTTILRWHRMRRDWQQSLEIPRSKWPGMVIPSLGMSRLRQIPRGPAEVDSI